jgi:hypothetical protein
MKGFAWFLFLGGIGAAALGGGVYMTSGKLKIANIWENGVEALDAGIKGEVKTTNFVAKEYDLEMQYLTKDGKVLKAETDFFRWFTGPEQGDKYTVRYLESDPNVATLSWTYDARWHGYVLVFILLAIGLLMLWVGWLVGKGEWDDLSQARRLARSGTLVALDITDSYQIVDEESGSVSIIFTLNHAKLSEPGGYTADGEGKMPWLVDTEEGSAVVALLDDTTQEYLVLRHDQIPLSGV